ncbi:MAG: FAD-binding oxidoreductase [Flavobacterium sp.]|uniref:NAD(P)/FAD-dependent oxidoreductase n=1 Tax=Flavobacterium sp. TaxID=239 RepID=UPI00121E3D5B|nr:FAD-binding oxidoreductase [Flavobacterium sp.]RZJ67561.1 MAG: FAD-binding oxidoreductase [Flavobacterium sp.]
MILKSGYPFWLVKDGLPYNFPKLDKDIETDVVVLGGGISGALVRYYLVNTGVKTVLIDARTIGLGSTCASTSLLQYEIDTPLHKLREMVGKDFADRSYHLCNNAITQLGKIAATHKCGDFEFKDSLYFAAYKKDVSMIKKEFEARKNAGFNVEFLDDNRIRSEFGFDSPAGILSHHGAQLDVYLFSHELLQHKKQQQADIYDRTRVVKIKHHKNGVDLETENGCKVKCTKLVYATGYEVVDQIDENIVDLLSTYAIVSEQFNEKTEFWKRNALLWNTTDPYLYLRTTPDRRILVGGRDEEFSTPAKREKLLKRKAKQLTNDFKKLFPDIAFEMEFSWAGTFGATKDGLPYIGEYEKLPNSYFALGFGGNGITFSLVAAEIITDLMLGKENKDAEIFRFGR